jgi:hypothetical protein
LKAILQKDDPATKALKTGIALILKKPDFAGEMLPILGVSPNSRPAWKKNSRSCPSATPNTNGSTNRNRGAECPSSGPFCKTRRSMKHTLALLGQGRYTGSGTNTP